MEPEKELIHHLRFTEIFEQSFEAYFEGLHRYAYTLLKENEKASDAVQAVFTKWWETKTFLNGLNESKPYLFAAVYRHCLNIIRNEKVRSNYASQYVKIHQTISYEEKPMELDELGERIEFIIQNLPPQCKDIFCKSRFEGKKYQEIASELNLSVKTIEAQMGKALKILRKKLNNLEDKFVKQQQK